MKNKVVVAILVTMLCFMVVMVVNADTDMDFSSQCLEKLGEDNSVLDDQFEEELERMKKEFLNLGENWTASYSICNNKLGELHFFNGSVTDGEVYDILDRMNKIYGKYSDSEDQCIYRWIGIENHSVNAELKITIQDNIKSCMIRFKKCCMYVDITINGEEYGTYSLKENQKIAIGNTNVCEIKDYTCRMIEANCPKQICVNTDVITENGGTIVCLPNKIVIEGNDDNGNEVTGFYEIDSVA